MAQMSSAFLCDFFGFGQEAIVDVFCSRSSPGGGLEHSASEHPQKNTKYLRTSKGGFCRYDFVFFSFRVCYDLTPIFCCGREDFKHESKIDDQICDNLCIGPKFDPFPRGLREPVPLRYLLLQTGCCFIVFRRLEKRHDKQLSFCTRRIPTSHSFRAPANGLLEWCLWLFHPHN